MQKGFCALLLLITCNVLGATTNNANVTFIEGLCWQLRQGGDEIGHKFIKVKDCLVDNIVSFS